MKRAFGELESAILFLFQAGGRMTVKDVHRQLGEKDKYTTIMTVMNRLAEKKKLGRERKGLQYEYWQLSNESQLPSLIRQFKDKIFGVTTSQLVAQLIGSATDMSGEELAEIEKIVKEAKLKKKESSHESEMHRD